jgi:hypothetical protein
VTGVERHVRAWLLEWLGCFCLWLLLVADWSGLNAAAGAAAVALAAATFGLWHGRLPRAVIAVGSRTLGRRVEVVRAAHSGIVGDYLLWLCAGTVLLAAAWLLAI